MKEDFTDLTNLLSPEATFLASVEERFDFLFIWLKPFVQMTSVNVSDYQPMVNSEMRAPGRKPFEELEKIAFKEWKFVSWSSIAKKSGLRHVGEIELAFLTAWNSIKDHLQRPDLFKAVDKITDKNNVIEISDNVIMPWEGQVLGELLENARIPELVVLDVDGSVHQVRDLESLVCSRDGYAPTYGINASDTSKSFYLENYFNQFSTVICGSEKLRKSIVEHPLMEGFFCNEKAHYDWWLEPNLDDLVSEWKFMDETHERVGKLQ